MKFFEILQEQLKGLEIDEAKVNEIIEKSKTEVAKEFIPKDKYNSKVSEIEDLEKQLDQTKKSLEEMQSNDNSEELKTKLDKATKELETFKEETQKREDLMAKKSKMKDRLIKEGADPDNVDLLLNDFNFEEMTLKDDKIVGEDDYVIEAKEKRSRLFMETKPSTKEPEEGNPTPVEDTEFDNKLREVMGLPPEN